LTFFEKCMAVTGSLIAAGGLWIGYATYSHTVESDKEQQISNMLKASATPRVTLPNIATKPPEKAPEQQPQKEPDKPVGQAQQTSPDSPPVETPKEPSQKEEPKPFTFWGYLPTGQGRTARPAIMFQVSSCPVDRTLVTCIMTATSAHYDRQLSWDGYNTTITHSEGDLFRAHLRSFTPLQLDRDAPVPFKLEFPVNKDLVKPIVVRLNGYDPNSGNLQQASFRITSK
jgi:hypothetical protein